MQRLLLFDIDGTLLSVDGAGKRAMGKALRAVFGTEGPIEKWAFGGKTDPQICLELMTRAGFEEEEVLSRLPQTFERYLAFLHEELQTASRGVKPGLPGLLERLSTLPGITLALLTGNIQAGAQLKLVHCGLERFFSFGAFGSDAVRRKDLVDIALERALERTGQRFEEREIVIIGDTPHDIQCGRHRGVRAIAVATGPHSLVELAEHAPDALFEDLSSHDAVLQAIRSE